MGFLEYLPKNDNEIAALIFMLGKNGVDPEAAEEIAFFLHDHYGDKKVAKVFEEYKDYEIEPIKRSMKKAVKKEYLSALVAGEKPDIVKCAKRYVAKQYHASGVETTIAAFRTARMVARNFSGGIRGRLSKFINSKRTQELIKAHPDVNPEALEYLVLTGKFSMINDDYEIFENFIQIMKREPRNTGS